MAHSEASGYGENIAFFFSSTPETIVAMLHEGTQASDAWYKEVDHYDFENPGHANNSDPTTGHFTQMVWKGTKELGCGFSGSYAVCRY